MRNELRGKEVVLVLVEKVKRPVAGKSRQQQILREETGALLEKKHY